MSVDREVVEKAKKLGLNISEVTELALRGFSFSTKEADRNALYKSYQDLFAVMKPLLEQYSTSVRIASMEITDEETGEIGIDDDIFLSPDGKFYSDAYETTFTDITKIPTYAFCTTSEILSNLVEALAKSVDQRKETMKELEMARRIVNAIASTMQSREEFRSRGEKKRHSSSKSRVT